MAEIDRASLVLAIKSIWFVEDRAKMRGQDLLYRMERAKHGWAAITAISASKNLVDGLKAAREWLRVIEQYGSGIDSQVHSIAECIACVEAKLDAVGTLAVIGGTEIEFHWDEMPIFVSAGKYLDRALMLQENDSGERKNRAKPKGGWNRKK